MDIPLILDRIYPGAAWGGSAFDYSRLTWKDTVIPKPTLAELTAHWSVIELEIAKSDAASLFRLNTQLTIQRGFSSAATGTSRWYDSEIEDQLNLIGTVGLGADSYYSTRAIETDTNKIYTLHTSVQLKQVMADGKSFKLQQLMRLNIALGALFTASDLVSVAAVVL